jgi:hypothetical protein
MAKRKISWYGVEEIHTLMVPDDSDEQVFVGVRVQGTSKGKKDFVMIYTPEQIIEIYDYVLERAREKREHNL